MLKKPQSEFSGWGFFVEPEGIEPSSFYMLILWLIFVEKLDTNTRFSRLVSVVSHRLRNIVDTNPFWMMSRFLGRKGHRLGETTRPSYYASEWIKLNTICD